MGEGARRRRRRPPGTRARRPGRPGPAARSSTRSPSATPHRRSWQRCSACRRTCSPTTCASSSSAGLIPDTLRGRPAPLLPAAVPAALDALDPARTALRGRGWCSSAPRTRPAPSWPPRCGDTPARSRPTSAGTHPAEHIASRRGRRRPPARPAAAPQSSPRHSPTSSADDDFVITVCDNAHEELDRRSRGPAPALVGAGPGPGRHRRRVRRRLRRPRPTRHRARAASPPPTATTVVRHLP